MSKFIKLYESTKAQFTESDANTGITFRIKNIKNPDTVSKSGTQNKFRGAYAKIFNILERDQIFTDMYWDAGSYMEGDDLILPISAEPDQYQLDEILQLRNVSLDK